MSTSRWNGVHTLKTASFDANKLTLDTLAETDGGFPGDVFLQKVFLYAPHRLVEVGFSKDFPAHDVAEEAADRTQT